MSFPSSTLPAIANQGTIVYTASQNNPDFRIYMVCTRVQNVLPDLSDHTEIEGGYDCVHPSPHLWRMEDRTGLPSAAYQPPPSCLQASSWLPHLASSAAPPPADPEAAVTTKVLLNSAVGGGHNNRLSPPNQLRPPLHPEAFAGCSEAGRLLLGRRLSCKESSSAAVANSNSSLLTPRWAVGVLLGIYKRFFNS
jgi:hypothetical protein